MELNKRTDPRQIDYRDRCENPNLFLCGVDKFEPVFGAGNLDHDEEVFGGSIISSGDGAVDFQTAVETFEVIASTVERPDMFYLDAAV
jgi:hypothetical protein